MFEIDVTRRDCHDGLHVFRAAKVCFGFSCCATAAQLPAAAEFAVIIINTCFDSGMARGHCSARSVYGGLCIFGDVRMHALYVHVWNRM